MSVLAVRHPAGPRAPSSASWAGDRASAPSVERVHVPPPSHDEMLIIRLASPPRHPAAGRPTSAPNPAGRRPPRSPLAPSSSTPGRHRCWPTGPGRRPCSVRSRPCSTSAPSPLPATALRPAWTSRSAGHSTSPTAPRVRAQRRIPAALGRCAPRHRPGHARDRRRRRVSPWTLHRQIGQLGERRLLGAA